MALAIVHDENTTGGKIHVSASLPPVASVSDTAEATASSLDSPLHAVLCIVAVLLLSPLIVFSNSLLLVALRRYKRLHTPSNMFLVSLVSSDLCIGLMLPFCVYFDLFKENISSPTVCVLPYCALITVCGVSLLSMTAIALDRCTSLARPLSYNNIITHQTVGRYVAIFCIYSLIMGSLPLLSVQFVVSSDRTCSFTVIQSPVRVFLFFMLYCPCAVISAVCYAYVYVVARYHAQAIYTVELSLRQEHASQPRYGRTLALTIGLFLGLWLPYQICMLSDALSNTTILNGWTRMYLAFILLSNSAANPWVYGFRSADLRLAFGKVIEEFVTKVGLAPKIITGTSGQAADHLDMHSFASNIRLCPSPNVTSVPFPTYTNIVETEMTIDTTEVAETKVVEKAMVFENVVTDDV